MNIMNQSGIYKITCLPTGKLYVGSAAIFRKRRDRHWQHLREKKHDNLHLQRAWEKYGPDAFKFEVLEVIEDRALMLGREQHWIDALNTYADGFNMMPALRNEGYTITLTPESRLRRSESMKRRIAEPGYQQMLADARRKRYRDDPAAREQFIQKIRASHTGKTMSAEVKANMSTSKNRRKITVVVMTPNGEIIEYLGRITFCKEHFPDSWASAQGGFNLVLQGKAKGYKGYRMARKGTSEEVALRAAKPLSAPNWRVHEPDGTHEDVVRLTEFCAPLGWNDACLHKAQGGKSYRGHQIEWIGPERPPKREGYARKLPFVMWKGKAFVWVATAPDGVEHRTLSMRAFCKTHGLDQSAMSMNADGKRSAHKGWTCKREFVDLESFLKSD